MGKMTYEEIVKETYEKVAIHELINFDKKPKNSVKVSIVMPVCNVEMYLRECLDSAVNQTLRDIEVICVNDGSKDNSLKILKEYAAKDSRVKVINKDNAGYGHTMNIGMDMAQGEYIGILESDDYVDLHMYEDLSKIADENQLDWIKADFNRFSVENGTVKATYIKVAQRANDLYDKVVNPKDDKRVFSLVMQTWSGIYRKSFLENNRIRHHESPGASYQDNGFWFQSVMYAKRVMFFSKPYYMNRRDNPNSSVHNKGKVYCMNREYDYIRNILEENQTMFLRYIFQYSYKKFLNYIFTFRRIGDEYKWEYLLEFQKELKTAEEKGEIDWSLYEKKDKEELQLIMKSPEEYFAQRRYEEIKKQALNEKRREIEALQRKIERKEEKIQGLERECDEKQKLIYRIYNSNSYKLGSTMLALPRKIKDAHLLKNREMQDTSNRKVHVVYITDENYCMPTIVSITSMKTHKKKDSDYTVHVMARDVSESNKEKLLAMAEDKFKIDILDVHLEDRFTKFTKGDGDLHVSPSAILKFQIPQCLNKVGKVIYLDGDVLIKKDLRELYNTDVKGKYAAVVKDILSERNPKHLKFLKYKNRYYFNSGMMLLNLTKMRKDNISEKLIDYRLNGINHFMDQDALNVVFKENVRYISPQFNCLNKFYDWWEGERLSVFYGEHMPEKAKAAYCQATIIHLGSHEKPWIYDMGYLTRLFKKYYRKSPLKKMRLEVKKIDKK